MSPRPFPRLAAALVATAAVAAPTAAQTVELRTLRDAADVLDDMRQFPLRAIPPNLLNEAHGICIIPGAVKAGFVIGGRGGFGVVLDRGANGTWGEPTFVRLGGASVGLQIGVQSTDLVLVFRTRRSLDRILDGKGKLTLGADAAVAAGPVGRQAEAGTDARLRAEIVSYSRSRGLFAGVSLEGAAINNDHETNRAFRRSPRPDELAAADNLKNLLTAMSGPAVVVVPGPAVVPPPPPPVGYVPAPSRVLLPPTVTSPPPARMPPATIPDSPQ